MKYNDNGTFKEIHIKALDTLPVGTEVDYDGEIIPNGWTEVESLDDKLVNVDTTQPSSKEKIWIQSNENIFDGVLESGTINEYGENIENSNRKRSKNYLPCKPNTTYTIIFDSQANVIVMFYNSSKTFISQLPGPNTWTSQPFTFTTPSNAAYIRFISYTTETTKVLIKVGTSVTSTELNINDSMYILGDDDIYRKFSPQNNIYSLEEIKIGTWIDGKPLYRKILIGTFANTTNFIEMIYNVSQLVNIGGTIQDRPWNYFINTTSQTAELDVVLIGNVINFRLRATDRLANQAYKIILEYTKTTD